MNICTLVIKEDSQSDINKKILSFIQQNQEDLMYDSQLLFKFQCVTKHKKYKNVQKCPTLIVNGKSYVGKDILRFLRQPTVSRPKQKVPQADDLSSYQDQIMMDLQDQPLAYGQPVDYQSQMQAMMQARQPVEKHERRTGRYDSLIGQLNQQVQNAPAQDAYQADFMGGLIDDGPDDYQAYALAQAGGSSGLMN